MDDLPALMPMWHNVTLKSVLGTPHYGNDATIFPDHTGAGVDISFKCGFQECLEMKSPTVRSLFAAKSCAVPFLHPNKVKSLHDPCMQNLKLDMKKQTDFCTKLDLLLSHAKRASRFRDCVFAAESNVSSMDNIVEECDKLSLPQSVMELTKSMPEHFPVPQANWRFTNGCVATLPYAKEEYSALLFYPAGPKMSRLRLMPIKETSSKQKTIIACEEEQRTVKLSGGKIYQIEAAEVQQTRLCCVRQEKTYHFVNLDILDKNEDPSVESFSLEQEISCISMSPLDAGHHVIITKDGLLFTQDANTKTTLWQLEEPLEHDPSVSDMWWGCSYGRSGPTVLCMDRMNLLSYDLRWKKKPTGVFSSTNPFLLKDEQLMVFQHWPGNEYQHLIASNHNLLICDERYLEQPVLVMNHMMEGFPIYCNVVPYSNNTSEYVVLLGSQEKQEMASFVIQSSTNVQPLSFGPPLHLSGISDCIQSLRLQGHAVDEGIIKRLSVPLIGVCAIPHDRRRGFTALQLSSLGDMFYQCFQASDKSNSEKTWKVGPGCVLTPADKIFPKLNDWMDQALVKKDKSPKKTWNTVDKSDILSRVLVQKDRSSRCAVCKTKTLLEGEKEVDSETCPSCGLHSVTSQRLMDAMKLGQIIVQPSSECNPFPALNLVDLSKPSGPLSKKLLKAWEDVDFMPSEVTQHVEGIMKTLTSTAESTHGNGDILGPSGTSIDDIVCSVGPDDAMPDSDRDTSRTPSVDGLVVERDKSGDVEDIIAPSQAIQPLAGETLRTPRNVKKRKLHSSAGF